MIEKIAKNFYMITLPMPFRLEHIHVFALVYDGQVALFDTGLNIPESFSKLEESLRTIGKSIHDIDRIFITHSHADHCGMAGRIKDISGAIIYMSKISKQFIQRQKREKTVIARINNFYSQHGLSERTINGLIRLLAGFKKVTAPFEIDICLEPGENLTIGDRKFEIISTPGHTSGHISFFFREDRVLLSGDHVLPDITPNLSPDLFQPDFRPLKSFLDSLTLIQNLPVEMVCPAHGNPFPNLKQRVEEIKEHHRERKGLILESVKERPKTTYQVSLDIFGRDLPEFDKFLALNETYVHLVELIQEGVIEERRGIQSTLYAIR